MLEQNFFLSVNPYPDGLGGHAHLKADLLKGHAIDEPKLEHLPVISVVAVFRNKITDLAVGVFHRSPLSSGAYPANSSPLRCIPSQKSQW